MPALYPSAVTTARIAEYSDGLADLAATHPLATPVPTCDGWTMADLTWHLNEVQHFWVHIIANRPQTYETYDRPERPADGAVADALRHSTQALVNALDSADRAETAWSWAAEQTVGFTYRRQTHEALVHYVDALLACGQPLPTEASVPASLAADGIDEVLTVVIDGLPEGARFLSETGPAMLSVRTTNSDDAWSFTLGELAEPTGQGQTHAVGQVSQGAPNTGAELEITGAALDLYLWLWNRPGNDAPSITGATHHAQALQHHIATSTH
jgi:uncharacterized protein (TIGR03083 family)